MLLSMEVYVRRRITTRISATMIAGLIALSMSVPVWAQGQTQDPDRQEDAADSDTTSAADSTADGEIRERITCFPAKGLVKMMSKINDLPEDRLDTVKTLISAGFDVPDGEALPDRLFVRDGDQERDFTLLGDGSVPDFTTLKTASKTSELCSDDPSRAGLPRTEDGIRFNLSPDIMFLNQSGSHDIAELRDGVKDGKSHFKKLFGGGVVSLLIPKATHVMVEYSDDDVSPDIQALKAGQIVSGLDIEAFNGGHVIALKELEKLEIDVLEIRGGGYKLKPVPSVKKMKSLGSGGS